MKIINEKFVHHNQNHFLVITKISSKNQLIKIPNGLNLFAMSLKDLL